MKVTDDDYEFAVASRIVAQLSDSTKSEQELLQTAKSAVRDTIIQTKQRLTWPLILVGSIFFLSNISVLGLLGYAMIRDFEHTAVALQKGVTYARLVEPQTVLSLVAGVTVQSIVAFVTIVRGYYGATGGEDKIS